MEMFPAERAPAVRRLSLVRLSSEIARSVATVGKVAVEGEVVQPGTSRSGAVYLTLRDRAAQITVVCPRARLGRCRTVHGERVCATGTLGYVNERGQLQLFAEEVVPVGEGAALRLLPRMSQADYAQALRDHDVGLALMYTPHPSLVPIEMASAGMLTVTNTFENKTSEALRAISGNLLAGPPAIEAIADALGEAVAGAGDAERRVRGSAVAWSRDWQTSFDDGLVARLADTMRWTA